MNESKIENSQPTLQQHNVIRWVSFNDDKPNEGQSVIIFEMGYGAWSCEFEYDKEADYSKSVWCPQPCV